jgi:hypothetical protein
MENTTGIRTLLVGIKEFLIMDTMDLAAQVKAVSQSADIILRLGG